MIGEIVLLKIQNKSVATIIKFRRQSKANAEHSTFVPPGGAPALNDATATFLPQMICKEVEGCAYTKYYEIVF